MKYDEHWWREHFRNRYEGGGNNMRLSVNNFGPISKAENIEICPLTVFVGPSNTGKSYLAILVYALLKSLRLESRIHLFPAIYEAMEITPASEVIKMFRLLEKTPEGKVGEIELSEFPEDFQKLVNKKMANLINNNFHEEAARCMGESSKENQAIAEKFSLRFEDDEKNVNLSSKAGDYSAELKKFTVGGTSLRHYVKYFLTKAQQDENFFQDEEFISTLCYELAGNVFTMHTPKPFYLPAARTGAMQSHRAIAGALVQRAPHAGLETVSVPTLSGIVSDFLEQIILMETQEIGDSRIEKVAAKIENEILHGSITSEISEANPYPRFLYRQNGLEVPLLRSSSMVTELAPIVLFIRHRIKKGDLLIIEEPEAHLHPEAQRKIAGVVAHLVRAGVRVMVTTHSDYFLDQLANYVRSSKLSGVRGRTPFLEEDEIGAYVFSQRKGRTIVKRLDFDKENGLSPEDHDKISSELYNETVDILEKLDQVGH